VFAGAALAQSPIFPPLISGEYHLNVITAPLQLDPNGVPLNPGGESIAAFNITDPQTTLVCVDTEPDVVTPVVLVVPAVGDRAEIRARAYEADQCVGLNSPDSPNAAYLYFTGPAAPVLGP
jgi:hypothetical protein